MENQNENVANTQGSELSKSNKELVDIKTKNTKAKRRTSEEILAKYFTPRKDSESFRILPPKSGRKTIEVAFFHVIQTNIAGGKKKFSKIYCPTHNDPRVKKTDKNGQVVLDEKNLPVMIPAPCPLCEKSAKLLETQDPSIKFIKKENMTDEQKKINEKNKAIFIEANNWAAKKFYIVRGIDMGNTKDDIKFWRFKHSFKGDGTLEKLLPALNEFNSLHQVSFTDVNNGATLYITMGYTKVGAQEYRTVLRISSRGKSPLHTDPLVIEKWVTEDITWREVFQPRKAPNITPFEYLQMVSVGIDPYWDDSDSNKKHWVFPNNPELEERANTRTQNLDADNDEKIEYASDVVDEEYSYVPISITPVNTPISNVETSITLSNENADLQVIDEEDQGKSGNEYDDLPF
jgi:hypothetical protein